MVICVHPVATPTWVSLAETEPIAMRAFALLAALLLTPSAWAVEVVLRDTIGPDSSATDGMPGIGATTNQFAFWDMPGMVLRNPLGRAVRLNEVRSVYLAFDGLTGDAVNEIATVAEQSLEFHLWRDGVTGPGRTFEVNPGGGGSNHLASPVSDLVTFSELGTTGPPSEPDKFTTFLVSTDVSSLDIEIPAGAEVVYSVVERENGDSISFLQLGSTISLVYEDVFHSTPQQVSPGFISSQLGFGYTNHASFATAEFLEGDYNGDGVVNAADYTVWRDNYGATDITPWSPGDGNGDGNIDSSDYAAWRNQFGMTLNDLASTPSPLTAVPEPQSVALMVLMLAFRRRQR